MRTTYEHDPGMSMSCVIPGIAKAGSHRKAFKLGVMSRSSTSFKGIVGDPAGPRMGDPKTWKVVGQSIVRFRMVGMPTYQLMILIISLESSA